MYNNTKRTSNHYPDGTKTSKVTAVKINTVEHTEIKTVSPTL